MKQSPLVSIVIPCYNHAQFVQKTIQSIIDQDYENIELIIIDDGSKDSSVDVIKEMIPACEARFKRFHFRHRPNKGLSATLNEGINLSVGDIIGFCSSDDIFHKKKTSVQVKYFTDNKKIKFCYTQAFVQNDNDEILTSATNLINKNLHDNVTFDEIFTFKVNFPVTGMYITDFLKKELNGFDEELTAEDYDINLRILSKSKPGFIEEKLYYYRSPAAIGSDRKRPVMRQDVSESHLKTINKYQEHPLYKNALREWNFRRFIYFSSYKQGKLYALCGMLNCLPKATSIYFYKAIIRLIFYWK